MTDTTTPIFASDGAYTTEAALALPNGSPAMVFCSDSKYRLALRSTEPHRRGGTDVWQFADGAVRHVTRSTAQPVLLANIRDDKALHLIAGALRFGADTATRTVLLEELVARPAPLLDEPQHPGAIAIDADGAEWVRVAGEGQVWVGRGRGACLMTKTWREVEAVRIESHGHQIESTEDKA